MTSLSVLATLNLVLGALVFLLGVVILRENPRQRLNRVVSLMLFFGGFGSLISALGLLARPATSGGVPAQQTLQHFAFLWEFFFPTLFLFGTLFPWERPFSRRGMGLQRWFRFAPDFQVLVYLPHTVHFLVLFAVTATQWPFAFSRSGALGIFAPLLNLGGLLVKLFLSVHETFFSLVNLGFGIAAIILLISSYRRARQARLRDQLRVIGFGLAACLALYSLGSLIPTLVDFHIGEGARSALTAAALTVGSGAIAYSIVRYKFLDAKWLARRGILYGAGAAAVVGVYLVVVVQLNHLLTGISGVDARVIEPVFLVFALIVFQPAMSRLEDLLGRMFLRDPADYRNVLRSLGRELMTTIELDTLLDRSIQTIAEAMLLKRAYVAALPRGAILVHGGAGAPMAPEDQARLRQVLLRLPATDEIVRLAEPTEGLLNPDHGFLQAQVGAGLLVLLRSRGEVVGALLLGEKVTGIQFTSEDVSLLSTLAAQMSVSLQNALLVRDRVAVARFEEELRLARQIQSSFLLSEFPRMPRFEVHALNIPSKEVAGDFYDLVPTGNGSFVLAIADVAGKGVPAALLSSMLQASLRTQAASIPSVAEILRNINSLVYRRAAVHQFATFFIARIDEDGLRMRFSNAGHNYPVIARRSGEQILLDRTGLLLGIQEATEYEETSLSLQTGDCLVLYTDGITEATDGQQEQFGEERLHGILRTLPHDLSARGVAERILDTLHSFLEDQEPRDDMTLLVMRVVELEPVSRVTGSAELVERANV
ncbi:MAG TPA: GAF domain-containing SpoIIE family protein phosphatase [Candidatus Eisenbacteria bacterium]|jgi:serine phosphatase RsbU (regulator of sigma subunit)